MGKEQLAVRQKGAGRLKVTLFRRMRQGLHWKVRVRAGTAQCTVAASNALMFGQEEREMRAGANGIRKVLFDYAIQRDFSVYCSMGWSFSHRERERERERAVASIVSQASQPLYGLHIRSACTFACTVVFSRLSRVEGGGRVVARCKWVCALRCWSCVLASSTGSTGFCLC